MQPNPVSGTGRFVTRLRSALAATALLATVSVAAGQTPEPGTAQGGGIRIGADGFVLPTGGFDLSELIAAAAQYLMRNIAVEPDAAPLLDGIPIRLQRELSLDALGCEDVLSQLLCARGFALVAIDADRGLWEVLHLQGARAGEVVSRAPVRTADEILRRPHLRQYVLTELRLEHLDGETAARSLRQLMAAGNRPGPTSACAMSAAGLGGSAILLLGGFQDELASAIRLLRACDRVAATPPPETASTPDGATAAAEARTPR